MGKVALLVEMHAGISVIYHQCPAQIQCQPAANFGVYKITVVLAKHALALGVGRASDRSWFVLESFRLFLVSEL